MSQGQTSNPRGAEWHRWDPHIHAPGTLLNDQFNGDWESYLGRIESAVPGVRAIGVTDYFCIETYREVRKRRAEGRLPQIDLIFPNVELRLDVKTERKKAINLHLLFSPDDPNHEAEIESLLGQLTFEVDGKTYSGTLASLEALGRAISPKQTDSRAAIREGANQFKVSLSQLRHVLRSSERWVAKNCLIAVSGSSSDGTAGIQHDDSFTAVRREIERMAHVIFAGTPSQRDYWLGKRTGFDRAFIEQAHGSLKPCLHGSDAHEEAATVTPNVDRYCWIKGDLTFEALRQAAIEPEERVWIGPEPPVQVTPAMCIDRVESSQAPWLTTSKIELNPGLVAIIGSRGSGKTALVDMIALGANAMSSDPGPSSFLKRAFPHLGDGSVTLVWKDGATNQAYLRQIAELGADDWINVEACYLSQHFVERLCASEGLATELRAEMERLVFEATDPTDRLEAESFEELANVSAEAIRWRREEIQASIQSMSDQIAREEGLRDGLPKVRQERDVLNKQIEADRKHIQSLVPKGKELRAQQLTTLEQICKAVEATVEATRLRRKTLEDLSNEVAHIRASVEPGRLSGMRRRFAAAGFDDDAWQAFRMEFAGDVDQLLDQARRAADRAIKVAVDGDPNSPVDTRGAPAANWPLTTLRSKYDALKKEVGIDAQQQKKYDDLQRLITQNELKVRRLDADISKAEGAAERRQVLISTRRQAYARVFDTFVEEENVLRNLYAPLGRALEGSHGALARLQFVVRRSVDLDEWAEAGERLLDLRNAGEFRGHGALRAKAEQHLLEAWQDGTAETVAAAMDGFRDQYSRDLAKAMPGSVAPDRRHEWLQSVAAWLYGTSHISVRYVIQYDGVAIEQLSPGTRGIVLLLLYLAVDQNDRRPLIIDQPEENLDPNSVFKELVPHFREVRRRRQVIIVTHNANLVVNTDVDQVVVATSSPSVDGGLPTISYESGGLENPRIRRLVCDILEGGERAFLERERRYRLRWREVAPANPEEVSEEPLAR